jgi:ProP effector
LVTKKQYILITKKVKNVESKSNTSINAKVVDKKRDVNKFKSVKSVIKKPSKKSSLPLKPVESATIKLGDNVIVQLGNSPMKATIIEISGKDINVQLDSGMIIKTQLKNIYSN